MSKLQGYLSITVLLGILLSKYDNGSITPISLKISNESFKIRKFSNTKQTKGDRSIKFLETHGRPFFHFISFEG